MSLTDTLGSLAVATKGQYMTGVSVDIGTSFVKPAGKVGDELIAKATVTGIGKYFPVSDLVCLYIMVFVQGDRWPTPKWISSMRKDNSLLMVVRIISFVFWSVR